MFGGISRLGSVFGTVQLCRLPMYSCVATCGEHVMARDGDGRPAQACLGTKFPAWRRTRAWEALALMRSDGGIQLSAVPSNAESQELFGAPEGGPAHTAGGIGDVAQHGGGSETTRGEHGG